jgi:hypothetical protein
MMAGCLPIREFHLANVSGSYDSKKDSHWKGSLNYRGCTLRTWAKSNADFATPP